MNKTFSISEAISFGWSTFKSNWKFWVIAFLLSIGIGSTSGYNYTRLINSSDRTRDLPSIDSSSLDYSDIGSDNPQELDRNLLNLNNLGSDVLGAATSDDSSLDPMFKSIAGVLIVMLLMFIVTLPLVGTIVLVSGLLKMGYINLTLDATRDKQVYYKTLLNQVSLKKSLRFFTAQLLVSLIVVLGLILFIIPGIIFALKYLFVPFVVVDQDAKIGESLKKSSQLTKGNRTKLLGMSIVFALISVLGFFALGYGVLVAAIVLSLAKAYVYNSLVGQMEASASQPDDKSLGMGEATVPASEGILASSQVALDNTEEKLVDQPVS